jgi:CheY-like chemotaxis protein
MERPSMSSRVFLPPAGRDSAARRAAPRSTDWIETRRGRILVIDDDATVARGVSRLLAGEHEVVLASGAKEAIDKIRAGGCFDVILCDLMMPDVTGMDFHDELRSASPALAARIIFMTGGAFTTRAREFLDEVPNARVEKPFDAQGLRALVMDRVKQAGAAP